MKISFNWLKEYIDINTSADEVSEVLTQTGLEVEGLEEIEKIKGGLRGLVVGEVIECSAHPNADKLKLTKVDIGAERLLSIVCGAPNVKKGQKVVVAPVNTTIFPTKNDPFQIKKAKIRGELSEGMICAEDEIGLGSAHEGVIVLDTDLVNGSFVTELFELGSDYIFEIGLTPNRGDAASHYGCARDLSAYFNRPIKLPELRPLKIQEDRPIQIQIEDAKGCPRYSGVTIRGIKVTQSPEWLKWRLRSIGLEPINNIVDITNYTLHSLGQPLHAFDADLVGERIIVKTLPDGTPFTTLDDKKRKLSSKDLMICNKERGMCIAGVFGGIESGIKDTTTSIFLESAYFSPEYIRGSSMRHQLNTDASFRFERGTDPEITLFALKFATQLIIDIAGGKVASQFSDVYPSKIDPIKIETKFSTFDRLIGISIDHNRIIEILNLLDIKTENIYDNSFTSIVPAFRSEVTREADLVEEVLRIYGINNIKTDESFSTGYLAEFKEIEPYKLQEELSIYLAGKGYNEIITNSLTNNQYETDLNLVKGDVVEILNPSSEELKILKPVPFYTGLESIRFNINRKQTNLKLFEFGKTYHKKNENSYAESNKLTLYLTGDKEEESWLTTRQSSTFHHLSGVITDLIKKVGININYIPLEDKIICQYGLEIRLGNNSVGFMGLLRNNILEYFQLSQKVYYAELNWDYMIKKASKEINFERLSKYPEVRRDLSLILDKSISYEQIRKISFNSEKKLLTRMNVFSVFEGDPIGVNKKSYAISFFLQDYEKTLNDKQIDKIMSKLMHRFETEINAIIRK